MKRRLHSASIMWFFAVVLFSKALWDTDPEEMRATDVAKHLSSLGFTQDAKNEELFHQTNMTLGVFLNTFNLHESDLALIPNGPPSEWQRRTLVEGNHTVLIHHFGGFQWQMTSNTPVEITVNIGYVRPTSLFVGMTSSRASSALAFIKAKEETSGVHANGNTFARFTLPDSTGLELEVFSPARKPVERPMLSTIARITLGETGKGFADWEHQKTQTVTNVPIAQFRKRGQ